MWVSPGHVEVLGAWSTWEGHEATPPSQHSSPYDFLPSAQSPTFLAIAFVVSAIEVK